MSDNDKSSAAKIDRDVSNLGERISSIEGQIRGAKWMIGLSISCVGIALPVVVFIINLIINSVLNDHSVVPNSFLEVLERKIAE